MNQDKKIVKISVLIACASALQIGESMIPHPIPFLRLGLANMITLLTLVLFGFTSAVNVALLRVVLSSFFLGTFLTPSFFLSFSGSLASVLVMAGIYKASSKLQAPSSKFSLVGISIFGALAHNFTQFFLAYLIIIKHKGAFWLIPLLIIGAVAAGIITGYGASYLVKELKKN